MDALGRFGSPVIVIDASDVLTLRDEFLLLLSGSELARLAYWAMVLS